MTFTFEQQRAIKCDNNVMLSACPGSGKTRVIVSKLNRVINDVYGTSRAIACITYTNAAVHEIEKRLLYQIQPGYDVYFDICTIHSFCLRNIFSPFSHFFEEYRHGFKIFTRENDNFNKIVETVFAKFEMAAPDNSDLEYFANLRINYKGEAIEVGQITKKMAEYYWILLKNNGYVDLNTIIYKSLQLIKTCPDILSYISSKFAWILVDEFQDTSDLQIEIFKLIFSKKRTKFFLVGDFYQSIYGFSGARPDLASAFVNYIGADVSFSLSGNFRSSNEIVKFANLIFLRKPDMSATGPASLFSVKPKLFMINDVFSFIVKTYLPTLDNYEIPYGESAILAPTWFSLYPLGVNLRQSGINIVGPGARPYRRDKQFTLLAEKICSYIMEPRAEMIVGIERELFNTILQINGSLLFDIFSYSGRMVVFSLIDVARKNYDKNNNAINWLKYIAEQFSIILNNKEYISYSEMNYFSLTVQEMEADMRKNRIVPSSLSLEQLGIFARPESALKLSTLHNAKGREFQAVAIIDLHEGTLPSWRSQTEEEIKEAKRLFYVGITRAKKILVFAVNNKKNPSRFITNYFNIN